MDIEAVKKQTLPFIDDETLRWLNDFCSRKRRKISSPENFGIDSILEYMDTHAVDYYFIQRNYSYLKTLVGAYGELYGRVEGIDRLLADL
ncbi:MAG: hypothetical protein HQK81_04960 [Desulfovibrionaceae bacterium]|nr:hypothetical protein [Desulfovibrionaceae bacterium]MBF0513395.1 hypothetical protein [Desulfovibrionaceae bacterium]